MFDRLRIVPKAVIALSAPFAALLVVGLAPFLAPATGGSPWWVSGVALAGLLAGLAAVFLAVRGVRRSLAQAVAAVDAVSTGDLETAVPATTQDEVGELVARLDEMRAAMSRRAATEREGIAHDLRLRRALDSVAVPVSVSDSDNRLIYLNRAAESLLRAMEPAWRKEVPGFSVASLPGNGLGAAFADPAIRGAYSGVLQADKTVEGVVAGRNLRLVASPVYDDHGAYQGRVTQWFDVTEELAARREAEEQLALERELAAENRRVRIALDHVSASVMLADRDRRIIYLNNAAAKLFSEAGRDFRSDLPGFDAGALLGSSIDVFHKNPRHQAELLERLSSSHEAEMEVAGRTLRIIANPVVGEDGERLGTAVEWLDRTEEAAVEREVDGLVAAARQGDLGKRVSLDDKRGFFLQLGRGLNSLLDELSEVFDEIARVMHRMSEGDLSAKINNEYHGKFAKVRDDINNTAGQLEKIIGRLNAIAGDISTASGEIASGNTNLSGRTEQQASSLQQTAASVEQLAATVRNNADNAQQANRVAASARTAAEQGGEVVSRAIDAMEQINESSGRIAEIIGVIDEIAFQTNLLALNASVEAARAGEQGRGFAVVATEVRNLASRSASAAKEIKDLIRDSVAKVEAGSGLVHDSGEKLAEIVSGVKKVGDIVAEIAAASAEQASGIEQVNTAINSMDEITQQNAALAEETSAASAAMNDNANEMRELMGFFRLAQGTAPKRSLAAAPAAAATKPRQALAPRKPEAVAARPQARKAVAGPVKAAPPPAKAVPKPATRPGKAPEPVFDEDEWEEF